MSYKVELTGHTRYFAVTDEQKDREFMVVEFYEENSNSSDWEVWEVMNGGDKYVEEGEEKDEIIQAVEDYMQQKGGDL
jgi:hypothetical protein